MFENLFGQFEAKTYEIDGCKVIIPIGYQVTIKDGIGRYLYCFAGFEDRKVKVFKNGLPPELTDETETFDNYEIDLYPYMVELPNGYLIEVINCSEDEEEFDEWDRKNLPFVRFDLNKVVVRNEKEKLEKHDCYEIFINDGKIRVFSHYE